LLYRNEKARLPPDLAFTLRDSLTSRDASLHPPVLKFVLVNVLLPTRGQRPCSHRRFHSSTRVKRYQPLTSSVPVVSHHLDGLSTLLVVGLFRPTARQDSQCCPNLRPASEDVGGHVRFPTAHSPFEEFPSLVAVPHHCGRFPLDVHQNLRLIDDLTVIAASDTPGSDCAV
jgi:hypothetical protein